LHRPPAPSAPFLRRLRAGGVGLVALLAWTVAAPGFVPAGALAAGGTAGAVLGASPSGEPGAAEWARLRLAAWQRGREAAAAAERDRAAARRAAAGAGATATPAAWTVPAGAGRAIPALTLRAYREAAAWAGGYDPGCRLSWTVLAGIGRIESNHGLYGGAATRFSAAGAVSPRITGPPLDGRGVAAIPDSDGGRWDGDTVWDRAVGPMQFLPGTWRSLGRDGNGDQVADPNNLFDAAVSAAGYLCLSGGDLTDPARLRQAVYGYNHSWAYVDAVLGWAGLYQGGVAPGPPVPTGTAPSAPTTGASTTGASTTSASSTGPPATDPTTTTRRATTTTKPPTSTTRPTTTTRPSTSTTGPPTTTVPPTTGSSTTGSSTTGSSTTGSSTTGSSTTTTEPCQPTTTSTSGEPTTTTSTTTTTTTPGGSTTTTTTLPPCG
jgi:membrane-bound lytic murein transglycosylase B